MSNFTFTDSFFKHIKAPTYKLEVVSPDVKSLSVFPPLEKVYFEFVDKPGVWRPGSELGLTIFKRELASYGINNAYATMWLQLPDALPNVLSVKGLIIPEAIADSITAWDSMGMDGNMHHMEGYESIGNGYVQMIHSSRDSHGNEGESHHGVIRFGVVFPDLDIPPGVEDKDDIQYSVDYQHIYIKRIQDNEDVITALSGLSWPGTWDFSILHRTAGSYTVEKSGKYILLRCV
ncbi:hypothetical protein ACE38W_22305 [Chitinophaga sp. Hz27]|uniref:hypothetical protein n=1 Tax=Chitinophaga sp. Hz27 TaxID=3347169 RepID=UPI0035E084A6